MNKKLLVELLKVVLQQKGVAVAVVKGTCVKLLKEMLNFILEELGKKNGVLAVGESTAVKFNIPVDIAIEVVVLIKKYFKL